MASIIYIASHHGLARRFMDLLEAMMPEKKFEIIYSLEDLSDQLRKPGLKIRVVVLFAVNGREMTHLISLGDLMADKKSLLVLSDDDKETITLAHTLRPRHMAWLDTDFEHIAGILRNMIDLYDAPPRQQERRPSMGSR